MTIFVYEAGVVRFRHGSGTGEIGGEVEFLDLSDATVGVDLDLPPAVPSSMTSDLYCEELQSFEALIHAAYADIIGARSRATKAARQD